MNPHLITPSLALLTAAMRPASDPEVQEARQRVYSDLEVWWFKQVDARSKKLRAKNSPPRDGAEWHVLKIQMGMAGF